MLTSFFLKWLLVTIQFLQGQGRREREVAELATVWILPTTKAEGRATVGADIHYMMLAHNSAYKRVQHQIIHYLHLFSVCCQQLMQ